MLIGSLASFAVERMQLRKARLLTNAALLTYVLPSSFLAIPFLRVAKSYGLSDNLWAVIAAQVMFATPFAVLILQRYAKLIPIELDEAARIDGASPVQLYRHIYLPLMAPGLAAVGTTRCCSPGASICTSTCCSRRRAIGPWRWRWSNS